MKSPAVFLDRDGTIIENREYIGDPDQVSLLPDAAETIQRFSQAGYLVVIASNQSGIARGLFDEEALARVHARMEAMLKDQGAKLDGAYYCPYLDGPEAVVESYRRDSNLRKPRPGMLLQAAEELDIDLTRSWMIGDSDVDIEAGRRAGCRTVLFQPNGASTGVLQSRPNLIARSLSEIPDRIETTPLPTDSSPVPTASSAAVQPNDSRNAVLLERIHAELERAFRSRRQRDFSLLQLAATLLQLTAVLSCVWGGMAMFDGESSPASARFTLACFLQLAAATAWMIDRFRE